jgi:hypothetical protein
MKVNVSLACWPALSHEAAFKQLCLPIREPLFGLLSIKNVQLVPQSWGYLNEERVAAFRSSHPGTQFRLHANVQVQSEHRSTNLGNFHRNTGWFAQAARVSRQLGASAYTAHSGRRSDANLITLLENARRCADLFDCSVGIEGGYPTNGDVMLVSTWSEYRTVFESGVPYVVDLSHLNILASHTGQQESMLVSEMLACERCIEVHLSDNDGRADSHLVCTKTTWWHPLLSYVHQDAVIFSEGNHRKPWSIV